MLYITHLIYLLLIFSLTSCQTSPEKPSTYNPKASGYNVQLGLGYLAQGNRERAKQKLLAAIAQDPQSATANDALAYYFESVQDIQQAETYYQHAVQFHPNTGAPLNNYGAFLCRQARYDEANKYFMRAIADPQYINTAMAYENAGLCAIAAGNNKNATIYLKKALAHEPSLQQAADALAMTTSNTQS